MALTLFTNVTVLDGSGADPFPAQGLVEGNRIKALARTGKALPPEGALQIDGGDATLMPGLVEAHGHISFANTADLKSLGNIPPEAHTPPAANPSKLTL